MQIARIEVVILNRVAGSCDVRLFETRNAAHHFHLYLERQTGRDAVRVDLDTRGPGRMHQAYDAYKLAEEILHPGPFRWTEKTTRLRNALVCMDVKAAGLPLRHAAEIIYGKERVERDWSKQKSMRDLMSSYLGTGERLANGGYRKFLQGGPLNTIERTV